MFRVDQIDDGMGRALWEGRRKGRRGTGGGGEWGQGSKGLDGRAASLVTKAFPATISICHWLALWSSLFELLSLRYAAASFEVCVGGWWRRRRDGLVMLQGLDARDEIADVHVAAPGAQLVESDVEVVEVLLVEAAGAAAGEDVAGQLVGVLGADKLLVVRGADVDEGGDGRRAVCRMEGRVMDGVAVDLADVEILLDLGDALGDDAVGDAPDALGGRVVVVGELFPVGALDEGHDATGGLGGASVVLAGDCTARQQLHLTMAMLGGMART